MITQIFFHLLGFTSKYLRRLHTHHLSSLFSLTNAKVFSYMEKLNSCSSLGGYLVLVLLWTKSSFSLSCGSA